MPDGHSDIAANIIGGKYRILREIARSNDVVYEAVDTAMGRRVAVKELVIPPNLTGAARRERIERFNREARAAGKLSHPNIVTVYDFGEDHGRYYIAMEFLEGMTLRDRLQVAGALSVQEAIDVARQVLSGLAHAHAHKVIHRDVKPENIHILPDGLIKLTDFGIARLTEEASLTGDGQVFGTPSYMSPEQIQGGAIDHRSDLFSTAAVLYEMLAGRKPFTGDSVVTITYAIMHADPAPLVGVPYAIEQVVRQGLAKDPARRFQSAEAMRQALAEAAALASQPMQTSLQPPSIFFPSQPPVQRPPSPWQTANPSLGIGTPTTVAALPPVPPPVQAPPVQAPPKGQVVVGPFATWGAPAPVTPPSPSAGGFAPRPAAPAVPEGVRTFLSVLAISFVLAGIILGAVLLFVRSYEEHQRTGQVMALQARLQEANKLVAASDLEAAARVYEEVLRASPDTEEGRTARTNLAETWNRLGVREAQVGHYRNAAAYFQAVLDLYDRYPQAMTAGDVSRQQSALENLQSVRGRAAADSGGEEIPSPGTPGVEASPDPGASAMAARERTAQMLLDQGNAAYETGSTALARELWRQAAEAAPGTEPSRRALELLRRTEPPPQFGARDPLGGLP